MVKRIFIGLVTLAVLGIAGLFVLAWRPAIAPIASPTPSSFAAEQIAKGAVLAGAGNCASCHSAPGGAPYAGGLGLDSGFGLIYSTNITPDVETGIGNWSQAAFIRAMHEGVARDGAQLLPAFPYTHFTRVSDDDLKALYAFLMTQPPVHAPAKSNTLPFPLNVRALQAGWKLLFFRKGRYEPEPTKSAEWNRGAYLAEGLGHCAGCHTPRNALGGERSSAAYAGGPIDGWLAPALTAANPAPLAWNVEDLYAYLRNGVSPMHGAAAGSMFDVVHNGLAKLPDDDIRAIAIYFADLNGSAAAEPKRAETLAQTLALVQRDSDAETDPGARLYQVACSSCHYNDAQLQAARPALALSSTLTGPDPANLIRVVLEGIGRDDKMPGVYMPGFAAGLSDADLNALASWLRRSHGMQTPWTNLAAAIPAARKVETTASSTPVNADTQSKGSP